MSGRSPPFTHMSQYLDIRWELFWVHNPSSKPFDGNLLWIWCLNIRKWAQNSYIWKLHEHWTLRFLKKKKKKKNTFWIKIEREGAFQDYSQDLFSSAILKYTGVRIKPSLTSSRNMSILSSVVCRQCSLQHSFGCHHLIVHKKSSLTPMHLKKREEATFKWVLRANYWW